jgi:hypothetical protein
MTGCGLEDLSPQLMIWTDKKLTTYQEDWRILQRALAEKWNWGLASVSEILLVWVTKCMCWMDATLACAQNEESKTGRHQSLLACCESEDNDFLRSSQVWELDSSLQPRNKKPICWMSLSHFYQKKKIKDPTSCWKICAHCFVGLQRHRSPGVHGGKYGNWLRQLTWRS